MSHDAGDSWWQYEAVPGMYAASIFIADRYTKRAVSDVAELFAQKQVSLGGPPEALCPVVTQLLHGSTGLNQLAVDLTREDDEDHPARILSSILPSVADGIASCRTLRDLNMDCCHLGDTGVTLLAEGIAGSSIQQLYLRGNNIGDLGATALGNALGQCRELFLIWVHANCIGDKGAAAIGAGLAASSSMQLLCLSSNEIGDEGTIGLVDGLIRSKCPLHHLFFSDNNIGDAGITALGRYVAQSQLTELHVGNSRGQVTDAGAAGLAAGIAQNRTLIEFHMEGCMLSDDGAVLIAEALAAHPTSVRKCGCSMCTQHWRTDGRWPPKCELVGNSRVGAGGHAAAKAALLLNQFCEGAMLMPATIEPTPAQLSEIAGVLSLVATYFPATQPQYIAKCVHRMCIEQPQYCLAVCIEAAIASEQFADRMRHQDAALADSAADAHLFFQSGLLAVLDQPGVIHEDQWTALQRAATWNCKVILADPKVERKYTVAFDGRSSISRVWEWLTTIPEGYFDQPWAVTGFSAGNYSSACVAYFHYISMISGTILVQPFALLVLAFAPSPSVSVWLQDKLTFTMHAHHPDFGLKDHPSLAHHALEVRALWVESPKIRLFGFVASSVALAILCTIRSPDADFWADPTTLLTLLMVAGHWLVELETMFADGFSVANIWQHFLTPWNVVDVVSLTLAAFALGFHDDVSAYRHLMSLALLFMWIRPLKCLYLLPWLGPYVFMMFAMVNDVLKIGSLAVVTMPGFICAQYVLFRDVESIQGCRIYGDLDDVDLSAPRLEQLSESFVILFEIFVGASESPRVECLRKTSEGTMAWLLQTLFVVVTVLLLLNMLIAAMAKTFDNVYDSLDMNFVYVKACTTMAVTCYAKICWVVRHNSSTMPSKPPSHLLR